MQLIVAVLSALIGGVKADSLVSIADFPPVVTLIDDDYPYQCVCTCQDKQVLGKCDYDKTTSCYCDYTPPTPSKTNGTSVSTF
jgi:hypothetical protein